MEYFVIYNEGSLAPYPLPKQEDYPLFGCTLLHIQCIYSCPTYLVSVSSIRNTRTRHVIL